MDSLPDQIDEGNDVIIIREAFINNNIIIIIRGAYTKCYVQHRANGMSVLEQLGGQCTFPIQ